MSASQFPFVLVFRMQVKFLVKPLWEFSVKVIGKGLVGFLGSRVLGWGSRVFAVDFLVLVNGSKPKFKGIGRD